MAYIDRSSNTRRTVTVVAVATIQAGLMYAVVTGLAVKFIPGPPPEKPMEAREFPIQPLPTDPIPPKPPETDPQAKHDPDVRPSAMPTDPTPSGPTTSDGGAGAAIFSGTGSKDVVIVTPLDPPPPPTLYKPQPPKPRNSPASWATSNDYPARDLREGNQGVTGFRLSVSAEGKVLDCQPIASSGSPSLDSATCDKVSRRAKFEPATDEYGNAVAGTYQNRIRWQIPK